ncbi:MAG: DNA polymerase sliding clamp [Methanophagales archaeon ANME-1-THS]|nr:MAG: DNA polymerase sliding clamp [Methanophagales archaeon ANME-1-THS]
MFTAKIDAGVLRECIEAITAVVDEGKLRITEEGLKLRAVDPANVAMVTFELQRDAFGDFLFKSESGAGAPPESKAATDVGIDFVKLRGILEIGGREEVDLKLDEQAQKLFTKMGSLSYTISLLDPSSLRKEPKVPDLEFPIQVIIETEEFRRTIRAAEKIGDHIVLGVDGEEFYMEVEGEVDKLRLGLRKEQLIHLTPGTLHSLYSLDYISAMSKGMSHATNITLNLGKDYPLQIEFEVAEGKGKVSYLLAPRIESE